MMNERELEAMNVVDKLLVLMRENPGWESTPVFERRSEGLRWGTG